MMNLLYGLLGFLSTSQLIAHFEWSGAYVGGVLVDYQLVQIGLSEILVVLILGLTIKRFSLNLRDKSLLTFLFFLTISSFYSLNKVLFWMSWGHLALGGITFLLVSRAKKDELVSLIYGLGLAGGVQLFLSVYQMISSSEAGGVFWLLGERQLAPEQGRVASFVTDIGVFLRPYGSFSHPNSLAGFGLIAVLILFYSKKYFFTLLWALVVALTGSTGAYLAAVLAALVAGIRRVSYRWREIWVLMIAVVIILGLSITLWGKGMGREEVDKRIFYIESMGRIEVEKFVFGVGGGNFIEAVTVADNLYAREGDKQPVHNIFLLFIAENGLVLTLVFGYLIYINKFKLNKDMGFYVLLMILVTTGSFDHYWITLLQNRLIMAIGLGIFINLKDNDKRHSI